MGFSNEKSEHGAEVAHTSGVRRSEESSPSIQNQVVARPVPVPCTAGERMKDLEPRTVHPNPEHSSVIRRNSRNSPACCSIEVSRPVQYEGVWVPPVVYGARERLQDQKAGPIGPDPEDSTGTVVDVAEGAG